MPVTTELDQDQGRRRIEKEDDLINHRMSWLVGSQSFLLAGFVLLRNNPVYYMSAPNTDALTYIHETTLLAYLVVIAGILISLCCFSGISAAFIAIHRWRQKVKQDERLHLTSDLFISFLGGVAAFVPGPVFIVIWSLLMREEWPAVIRYLSDFEFWAPIVTCFVAVVLWSFYSLWVFVEVKTRQG